MELMKRKIDKTSKPTQLRHISDERVAEISRDYTLFGIEQTYSYPGAEEFSRRLQKIGNLRYDQITFISSNSTLSPFKTK